MASEIHELDHLMCGVVDLDQAGDSFARLGFTVGPITQSGRSGCRNRRIHFTPLSDGQANYLELIQPLRPPTECIPPLDQFLAGVPAGEEGVRAMIMATRDAAATHAHFERRHAAESDKGFAPDPLFEVDYVLTLEDGASFEIGFSNAMFPRLRPPVWVSTCQIRSFDFYLHPPWRRHPNTAQSLVGVTIVARDPEAAATCLGDFWDVPARETAPGRWECGPGEISIAVHSPESLWRDFPIDLRDADGQPRIVGYRLAVEDISAARAILAGNSVRHREIGDRILIRPEEAHGQLIELTPAPQPR